jgi:hypothetical protein
MLYAFCCGCKDDKESGKVYFVLFNGTEPLARVLPLAVTVTSRTLGWEELGRVMGVAPAMNENVSGVSTRIAMEEGSEGEVASSGR